MAYQFNLSYYYITPENSLKLDAFSEASGDSRQILIMQYVRGWLGRNRLYYAGLARLDLRKREINIDEWVEVVINQGFESLPDYKSSLVDSDVPPNPLGHIVLPGGMDRQVINYIYLTKQNYILLRTAIYFDGSRIAQYLSKIIHEHLQRNWEPLYAPQMDAETSNDWLKGKQR
ncbi:transposase [aff. Roholtiella sp. LEGE 12411]|uniref:transposase n=1 Tax=aff. Roholtiella sp. LEGE 12411 TaxID=1828822 RepID=UPI00187F5A6A|nr:transposase [aff. Roholtiella sp. LEGE 12411]MBE9037661.1 transposase [aff. Roholtiella sp. LEGE 12411]